MHPKLLAFGFLWVFFIFGSPRFAHASDTFCELWKKLRSVETLTDSNASGVFFSSGRSEKAFFVSVDQKCETGTALLKKGEIHKNAKPKICAHPSFGSMFCAALGVPEEFQDCDLSYCLQDGAGPNWAIYILRSDYRKSWEIPQVGLDDLEVCPGDLLAFVYSSFDTHSWRPLDTPPNPRDCLQR